MITAVVLTKNSEKTLTRCLDSVSWADEILVIDAESEDKTQEICRRYPNLNFQIRKWTGFRDQRNFALKVAKNDWIFSIDSDEACTPQLAQKLKSLVQEQKPQSKKAYKVHRTEYFLGKPVRYGVWNPSYQDRFFLKEGVQYVNEVHEYPKFLELPGIIHETIEHWPDFNVEQFLDKMNRYTTIEARDRFEQGMRTNPIHLIGAGPAMFLKNYFYYSAYKDGWRGVVISLLEGVSRTVRHIKLWQLELKEKTKNED